MLENELILFLLRRLVQVIKYELGFENVPLFSSLELFIVLLFQDHNFLQNVECFEPLFLISRVFQDFIINLGRLLKVFIFRLKLLIKQLESFHKLLD
jgi:hypothetical protein